MAGGAAALRAEIMNEMRSAMSETRELVDTQLHFEVESYYSGGGPGDQYVRTGTLLSSPITSPLQEGGTSISFESQMNEGISYSTGSFSGADVIQATEEKLFGVLGGSGYFARFLTKVPQIVDQCFGAHFS